MKSNPTMYLFPTLLMLAACSQATDEHKESTAEAIVEAPIKSPLSVPQKLDYPSTATIGQVDNYHGTEVADPYRWLEDDVRESNEVAGWVDAQNQVTFAYLEGLPERQRIIQRLTELWDYQKYGVPFAEGGKYFYMMNNGLQNQSVLYVQDSLDGVPRMVVDPNTWSDDGTVALADVAISPDGRTAALAVQDGGSDWRTIRFVDVASGEQLEDEIEWVKFSPMAWAADSSGIYYSRFPQTGEGQEFQSLNSNHRVHFHALGAQGENDHLIYGRDDEPTWLFFPELSEDGRFMVITAHSNEVGNQLAFIDLENPDREAVYLTANFDYEFWFVGNRGRTFYIRTNIDAPRSRLIAVDIDKPGRDNWRELVGESDDTLRQADLVGEHFLAVYLKDAFSLVRQYDLNGKLIRDVDLPGIGSAIGFGGKQGAGESFYSYSSFNSPPGIYRYEVATGESTNFKRAAVDFDPSEYVVRQVFYRSGDGTEIPMFIAHRNDIEIDGNTPALLYGYGGFNIAISPSFSVSRLAWMEMGGVFALANIRGGGEYGEAWHLAGTKLNKQNVFDDFIAAAEYLVANNYTRPEKLSVMGGSNGGLLVGAVVNQRPDLFGAALPAVGVMDMLRFHHFTAGRFWVADYGSADDPEEFKALLAYSPYHNIKEGVDYPAILVTTADTDDRVVPGHSFKYAARLQELHSGSAPALIRIETRAGHGSGKPTSKTIEEYADKWAFLAENLNMTLPEGYGN